MDDKKGAKKIADELGFPKYTIEYHAKKIRDLDPEFGSRSDDSGGMWLYSAAEIEQIKNRISEKSREKQKKDEDPSVSTTQTEDKYHTSTTQVEDKYNTSTGQVEEKQSEDSDRNRVKEDEPQDKYHTSTINSDLLELLKAELDSKNEQLRVKDDQIRELNNRLADTTQALSNAQQLAQGAQALLAQEQQKLVQKIDAEEAEITEDPEPEPEPEKKKGFWARIFGGSG